MKIARRLFVVPLADNNQGKSTVLKALVSQGLGQTIGNHKKGVRLLTSPWGRPINAYVFGRSYQEVEKKQYQNVEAALEANDPDWRDRELVIMPSHVTSIHNNGAPDDIEQMVDAAHGAGFDAVCASVIFTGAEENGTAVSRIWRKSWDERWTIPNPSIDRYEGQLEALGRDLWTWICRTLAP